MGNWCPLIKKPCKPDCVWFRIGIRLVGEEKREVSFQECAINEGVDALLNLIGRSIGQQAAIEDTRNEISNLVQLFTNLAIAKTKELSKRQ